MDSAALASTARAATASTDPIAARGRRAHLARWARLLGALLGASLSPPAARAQTPPPAVFTTLHSFVGATEGTTPLAGLLIGLDGNFYGTTFDGGANGNGTVFRCTPDGTVSVLHTFSAFTTGTTNADGAEQQAALIQDAAGNLYGMAAGGGVQGHGTAFEVTLAGGFSDLHDFGSEADQADGAFPGSLLLTPDGLLVGTTFVGGDSNGDGTLFFLEGSDFGPVLEFGGSLGSGPFGSLALSNPPGAQFPILYGACESGGNGSGVIFRLPGAGPGASLLATYTFSALDGNSQNLDGARPKGGLILGRDNNLYGATSLGGPNGDGTVWQIVVDPNSGAGSLNVLHAFIGSDGSGCFTPLVEGSDGSFYGTTFEGGTAGTGVVFRVTTAKGFTVLHSFSAVDDNANSDGADPLGGLVEVRPGSFVGTASSGGANGSGTVFEVDVPPVITSAATATGNAGSAFSYQITAADGPVSYSVVGLGDGLTFNATTGLISGTPTAVGTLNLTVNANNDAGTGSQAVTVTITSLPVVTSGLNASATQGQPFSYQITATNTPTGFSASNLPTGITLNTSTGMISGTPIVAGKFAIQLQTANASGPGAATLTLKVAPGLPAATLTAPKPIVQVDSHKIGEVTVEFLFSRQQQVVVHYSVQGSAVNGKDYEHLSGKVKFAPGEKKASIKIVPLGDLDGAMSKLIKIRLEPGKGYIVEDRKPVTITILGQD